MPNIFEFFSQRKCITAKNSLYLLFLLIRAINIESSVNVSISFDVSFVEYCLRYKSFCSFFIVSVSLNISSLIMENFSDLLDQGFLDIFTIFSLGIRTNFSSFLPIFFLVLNAGSVLTILSVYVYKGKLMISADALSQVTDVFELFSPIFVHVFLLTVCVRNHKMFNKICMISDSLDKTFKKLNLKYFKKIKKFSILNFALKFFTIHGIGVGIDSFVLIT